MPADFLKCIKDGGKVVTLTLAGGETMKACKDKNGKWHNGEVEGKMKRNIETRALPINATFDAGKRTIEVVAATENPVAIYDWDRGIFIDEVLQMEGLSLPQNRQLILLDAHSRFDNSNVVGSARNLMIEGNKLNAKVHFSDADENSRTIAKKVEEGHITDFSIGYSVEQAQYIDKNKSEIINGKQYKGPVKVVTRWNVKELSVVPIGADENAKARSYGMDEKLKKMLEEKGLQEGATEEEALLFFRKMVEKQETEAKTDVQSRQTVPGDSNQGGVDIEKAIADAIKGERIRLQVIDNMCRAFGCESIQQEIIEKTKTEDEARQIVMEHMMKQPETSFRKPSIRVIETERDTFKKAALGALLKRANVGTVLEKEYPSHERFIGYTLKELCREAMRAAGVRDIPSDPQDMFHRALSTSDFPFVLGNIANKSLLFSFEKYQETYEQWVDTTGNVSDFKESTLVRPGEVEGLLEIKEGGEYKYDARTEQKESYSVGKYGRQILFTWEAMVNDDLGALNDTAREYGEAVRRLYGDLVYAVLTSNPSMGDGNLLFDATNHSNLVDTGSGAAVSVATLGAAETAMSLQTDIGGNRRLQIKPMFYLAPNNLRPASETFFRTAMFGGADSQEPNIYADYVQRIYEPRLYDNSTTAWYLAGMKGKTIKMFFLNGQQTPYMRTEEKFDIDAVATKVRAVAVAKAVSWRYLYKNAGT